MRFVVKGPYTSEGLDNAHTNPPADDVAARERWRKFKLHKKSLLAQLVNEQYLLCCYSELRADLAGLNYHIEHVVNKGMAPLRTFDYSNLSASAVHSEHIPTLPKGQVFGGHAPGKTKPFDESVFVSCHNPDCASFFAYLSDGRIVPREGLTITNSRRARYTIDLLNLDSPYLVVLRRNWWTALETELSEYGDRGLDLAALVRQDLLPADGKLNSFFSLTRQFYGPMADVALETLAPNLL